MIHLVIAVERSEFCYHPIIRARAGMSIKLSFGNHKDVLDLEWARRSS